MCRIHLIGGLGAGFTTYKKIPAKWASNIILPIIFDLTVLYMAELFLAQFRTKISLLNGPIVSFWKYFENWPLVLILGNLKLAQYFSSEAPLTLLLAALFRQLLFSTNSKNSYLLLDTVRSSRDRSLKASVTARPKVLAVLREQLERSESCELNTASSCSSKNCPTTMGASTCFEEACTR